MTPFGELPDGRTVHRLRIGREPGLVVDLLDLGATLHRLEVPLADGPRNVALGHSTVSDYLASTAYVGAVVGRYGNRIAHGHLPIDGVVHRLPTNDRGHTLHGGPDGFDRRLWEVVDHGPDHAELVLTSPDGDQGFPGELTARVRYEVDGDSLRLTWTARTTAPTPVNLTTHAYWNLDGEGSGAIEDHLLTVPSGLFAPTDATAIPLGHLAPVDGTPLDLRRPTRLGDVLRRDLPPEQHDEQLVLSGGIDHSFVVPGQGVREVAVLESPAGGLRLRMASDQPAVQVYTGNKLDGTLRGTSGGSYEQGAGIALEPQLVSDSPHRTPAEGWPSCLLRPGEDYLATTVISFSAL